MVVRRILILSPSPYGEGAKLQLLRRYPVDFALLRENIFFSFRVLSCLVPAVSKVVRKTFKKIYIYYFPCSRMNEFTVVMVAILLAIYIASCVLKRRSLIYLTVVMGVC